MRKLHRFELTTEYVLPAAYSRAIGRVVVHWSYLEYCIQRIVWILVGIDDVMGRVAVREPRAEDRVVMIRDLASLRSVKIDNAELDAFESSVRFLSAARDLMVHGIWAPCPDGTWRVLNFRGQHSKDTKGPPHRSRRMAPGTKIFTFEAFETQLAAIKKLIDYATRFERTIVEQISEPPKLPR